MQKRILSFFLIFLLCFSPLSPLVEATQGLTSHVVPDALTKTDIPSAQLLGNMSEDVIATALSYEGKHLKDMDSAFQRMVGNADTQWCGYFVWWCGYKAGLVDSGLYPPSNSFSTAISPAIWVAEHSTGKILIYEGYMDAFKERPESGWELHSSGSTWGENFGDSGTLEEIPADSFLPQKGDIIICGYKVDDWRHMTFSHTGYVRENSVVASDIYTIEGNTSNPQNSNGGTGVYAKTRHPGNPEHPDTQKREIIGYVRPNYHNHSYNSLGKCTVCGEEYHLDIKEISPTTIKVTAVNSVSGTAPAHTLPYGDANITSRYSIGDSVTVNGYAYNCFNNLWWRLSDGGTWLNADYLDKAPSMLSISGQTYPTGNLQKGRSFGLAGIIESNYAITNVSAHIYIQGTNNDARSPYVAYPNSNRYDIYKDGLDSEFRFGELSDGYYTYVVTATDDFPNTKTLVSSDFTVGNPNPPTPTPPTPQAPTISVGENYKVGDTVTVTWNPVEYASSYSYYVTEYPEGYAYTDSVKSGRTTDTHISFNDLPNGTYTVFVHAHNSQDTASGQSNWTGFNVYQQDYIPTNSVTYNGHLYVLYDYEVSWSFARALCDYFGGHLVSITSEEESNTIKDLISTGGKNRYWLGAMNVNASDYQDTPAYTWITRETFQYSDWAAGEPNGYGGNGQKEHFAQIIKSFESKWNDASNTYKVDTGFILEIEPSDSYIAARDSFNGNTYLVIDKNTTWTDAKSYCELLGGHLVTFNSDIEREFVNSLLQQGKRSWYYLGAAKMASVWTWIDGTPGNYIAWNENEPAWDNSYLMVYKESQNSVSFTNAYFPASHIGSIGFVCEIEKSEPLQYTITYDANGGFGTMSDDIATAEVAFSFPPNGFSPPDGKEFETWNVNGINYRPGDTCIFTANTTVFPVWKNMEPTAVGTAVNTVSLNENTVTANVVCADSNASVFCAVYNNSGKMIAVHSAQITSESNYQFQFDGQQFDYAKAFIVDSNFCPLCESKKS